MSEKKMKFCSNYGFVLFVSFIVLLIIGHFAEDGSTIAQVNKVARCIFLVLFFGTLIIGVVAIIVKYFADGIANIRSSGDSVFPELDNYHRNWGESKEHYNDMINVIHFYYEEGKVDNCICQPKIRSNAH